MRIYFLALMGFLSQLQTSYGQAETAVSLNTLKFAEYIDLVGKHNLDYAAERFEVSKSEAGIEIAKVFPDPTLSFGMSQDREGHVTSGKGISGGLDETVDLFGKRKARIELAKSQHELSKALLADFFRNLEAQSAETFLLALKQKQLYEVKLNSYQTMKRLAEADSIRLKLGSIMEINAVQSKLEAGSLYNDLLQTEADLRNSYIQLSQTTGSLKEDTLWIPAGSLIIKPRAFVFADLMVTARDKRADLVAALYNKEVAHKALRLAQKERKIDLGLALGISNSTLASNLGPSTATISAGIAIPLRFSNYYKGELKQAQFQISQSEVLYEKAELQIRAEIMQAMQNYQASSKQVESFDHGMLESAQSVRKGKIYSYSRGETSLLEVLNAQRTFNDIQQSYYETLFNRAVALVELEKAAGIWDVDF
jgi:outer membrane protein, heavy metal efflux system